MWLQSMDIFSTKRSNGEPSEQYKKTGILFVAFPYNYVKIDITG